MAAIDPKHWSETEIVDLVYHRPTRSAFFVRITDDWKAASKFMLSLDRAPDDLPALCRQAIAFWWHKGPLGDGPRPF